MRMTRALLAAALTAGGGSALAAPPAPGEQITRYNELATKFEQADTARQVTHEIGTLRAWLGEAQAYHKKDDEELLARTLKLVRVQARMIDALLARHVADEAARQAHEQADVKDREAATARNTAMELEQKLEELEAKGQSK